MNALNPLLQPQNDPKQPLLMGVGLDSNKWVLSNVFSLESRGIELRIVGRRLLCWRSLNVKMENPFLINLQIRRLVVILKKRA